MKLSRTTIATEDHIESLLGRLRDIDNRECLASIGKTADENLKMGFEISTKCWTILLGDQPIGAFGVAPEGLLSNKGIPWLLATDDLKKISYNFLRQSKEHVREMLEQYDRLENHVDIENKISSNWLKWCGFKMEEPKVAGVGRKLFRRFWMDKGGVCADQRR
jgi:hypothetical protein